MSDKDYAKERLMQLMKLHPHLAEGGLKPKLETVLRLEPNLRFKLEQAYKRDLAIQDFEQPTRHLIDMYFHLTEAIALAGYFNIPLLYDMLVKQGMDIISMNSRDLLKHKNKRWLVNKAGRVNVHINKIIAMMCFFLAFLAIVLIFISAVNGTSHLLYIIFVFPVIYLGYHFYKKYRP